MRLALTSFVLMMLCACGSSPSGITGGDGGSCAPIGSDEFCGPRLACCNGGWCDTAMGTCRDGSACGRSGQGCDANHSCCTGFICASGACATDTMSGGGNGTTATSGSCLNATQPCGANSDCCSGFCAPQTGECAEPVSGSGNGSGTGSGTNGTTGGTCLSSGAGCSASTDCCSHVCSGSVCG